MDYFSYLCFRNQLKKYTMEFLGKLIYLAILFGGLELFKVVCNYLDKRNEI